LLSYKLNWSRKNPLKNSLPENGGEQKISPSPPFEGGFRGIK
jgi:hypothetical protein